MSDAIKLPYFLQVQREFIVKFEIVPAAIANGMDKRSLRPITCTRNKKNK
tara:strand:- start:14 stop:163 length:150 start_codon:yes stop_codon:yes gene_type:complete